MNEVNSCLVRSLICRDIGESAKHESESTTDVPKFLEYPVSLLGRYFGNLSLGLVVAEATARFKDLRPNLFITCIKGTPLDRASRSVLCREYVLGLQAMGKRVSMSEM